MSELKEGHKADAGKPRPELIPGEFIMAVATILAFGASKYEDWNWAKGIKYSRIFGAAIRHLYAWWSGKSGTTKSFIFADLDFETEHSHLWHAACCIIFLICYEEWRMSDFDDRLRPRTSKD